MKLVKRYLIVTLVLQHPLFDYGPLFEYVQTFDWKEACAHTASNKSVFLFTDKPEKEIQDRMRSLIGPEDFCSLDPYDDENGAKEIAEQAQHVREWILG